MFVQQMLPSARRRLAIASVNAPLAQVAGLLCQDHINLAVICDLDGGMVGVITDSDIVHSVSDCAAGSRPVCTSGAAEIMTREVLFCHPNDHLHDVWAAMEQRGLRHIPVIVDEDNPTGVLYACDIMDALFGRPEAAEAKIDWEAEEPAPLPRADVHRQSGTSRSCSAPDAGRDDRPAGEAAAKCSTLQQ